MILKSDLIDTVNEALNRNYCAGTEKRSCLKDIETASKANPCSIKITGHGYSTGDKIWIKDVEGMLDLNDKTYTVTKVDADNFTIGVDSSEYDAHTANTGTCVRDDLDEKIITTLIGLSKEGDFLQDEFKRQTIAERDYYSLPDNLKKLLFVGLKSYDADPELDNATIYKDLIYERWKMYKRNIYLSSTTGTPTRYTWMSGFMYPRPIPDKVYNMYFWYSFHHPKTVTVDEITYKACDQILFKDIYQEVLEMGLLYRVALSLGLADAAKFGAIYGGLVAGHRADIMRHPKVAAYRDGF